MIEISVALPLDKDGFLRRECPYCSKQFKAKYKSEDIQGLLAEQFKNFMVSKEEKPKPEDEVKTTPNLFCPYCAQEAPPTHWWTHEQLDYIRTFAKNIMTRQINEQLIRPLSRMPRGSGPITMTFKGQEIKEEKPWISPEPDDMKIVELPCCQSQIKIEDSAHSKHYCLYCGFPHGEPS
jgi:hypothetical protein